MDIKSNEKLWALTDQGPLPVRAERMTSGVAESAWMRCSAVNRAKGPRVCDWAAVDIWPLPEQGKGHWLLARRSIAKPNALAYCVCFGPTGTTLEELVRVAGTRWAIEECSEEARGEVGLDQYEVRRWDGRYGHITLVMLAHPYLTVIRNQVVEGGEKGYYGPNEELIPLTVPEVRRLLTRLLWAEGQPPDFILHWSWWRRRHQARARQCHYKRRLSDLRP